MVDSAAVVVDHRLVDVADGAVHHHVLVHRAVLVPGLAAAEEAEVPARVVPAVPDRPSEEVEEPVQVVAGLRRSVPFGRHDLEQPIAKGRRHDLVRVEDEDPAALERKVVESPVLLPRVPLPLVVHHARAGGLRDLDGPIGRAAVDHEDATRPSRERREAVRKIGFLVAGDDHHVDHGSDPSWAAWRASWPSTEPQVANRNSASSASSFRRVDARPTYPLKRRCRGMGHRGQSGAKSRGWR